MKISAKIDYAVRALVELGLHWPNTNPKQVVEISRVAQVPQKFLIHILIALKSLGYVQSVRGKTGGYVLALDPREIIMADIVKELGGLETFDEKEGKKAKHDAISLLWREIDKSIVEALRKVTLEELCNRQRQQVETISFEI